MIVGLRSQWKSSNQLVIHNRAFSMSNYLLSLFNLIVIFSNFFITPINIFPNPEIIIVLAEHIYPFDFQRIIDLDCHIYDCQFLANNSVDYHKHDNHLVTDTDLGNQLQILMLNYMRIVGERIIQNWGKYDCVFNELSNQNPIIITPSIKDNSNHQEVVVVISKTY